MTFYVMRKTILNIFAFGTIKLTVYGLATEFLEKRHPYKSIANVFLLIATEHGN